MRIAAVVFAVIFAVILLLMLSALVEMYHQLRQIRNYLELVDKVTQLELELKLGPQPSSYGLPAELDTAGVGIVLFLSNRCETCRTLAQSIRDGAVPDELWVVVEPVYNDADHFVAEFGLRGERVLVDTDGLIAENLGLDVTPSAVVVESGSLVRAQTVPSLRQLHVLLPAAY